MDKQNSNQDQLWKQCPKGMLHQVADRSAEQNRNQKNSNGQSLLDRRGMLKIAASIAVTAGAGTLAYQSLFPQSQPLPGHLRVAPRTLGPGGISCREFINNLKEYSQKTLKDQELLPKMDKHLELCEKCRSIYDDMQRG